MQQNHNRTKWNTHTHNCDILHSLGQAILLKQMPLLDCSSQTKPVLHGHRCAHKPLQTHRLTASTHKAGGDLFKCKEASGAVTIKLILDQHSSCYLFVDNNKGAVMCDLQQFTVHHKDQKCLHPLHSLCSESSISVTAGKTTRTV